MSGILGNDRDTTMDHNVSHSAASLVPLLLVPLFIWLRLRRVRQSARSHDFWFEPEGDQFIYHPFGRFGKAYLVTAAARVAIRARVASFARVAGLVLMAAVVGPMLLLSEDPALYWHWRPYMLMVRIAMVLALIPAGLLWRVVAVRPIYAGAPLAPRRISVQQFRAKQAASRSWWAMGLAVIVLGGLAAVSFYAAYVDGMAVYAVPGVILAVLLLFNIRLMVTKLRLRGG
jgi:hypothetical protein